MRSFSSIRLPLFLCDKPPSTSRACTKMYLAANGQSSRRLSYSIIPYTEKQVYCNG